MEKSNIDNPIIIRRQLEYFTKRLHEIVKSNSKDIDNNNITELHNKSISNLANTIFIDTQGNACSYQ